MSSFNGNDYSQILKKLLADKESSFKVKSVNFVNDEILKLIKTTINGISTDISANQLGALYSQGFIEKLDAFVGKSHLFKSSILLVKAWYEYEVKNEDNETRLSSWALTVMVVWIFNCYGKKISNPVQALSRFLLYFADFDWSKFALTVHGPVSAVDLGQDDILDKEEFFPAELLDFYKGRYESARNSKLTNSLPQQNFPYNPEASASTSYVEASTVDGTQAFNPMQVSEEILNSWVVQSAFGNTLATYKRGALNIMDPITPNASITKRMDPKSLNYFEYSIRSGYRSFAELCQFLSEIAIPNEHAELLILSMNKPDFDSVANSAVTRIQKFFNNILNVVEPLTGNTVIAANEIDSGLTSQVDELEVRLNILVIVIF